MRADTKLWTVGTRPALVCAGTAVVVDIGVEIWIGFESEGSHLADPIFQASKTQTAAYRVSIGRGTGGVVGCEGAIWEVASSTILCKDRSNKERKQLRKQYKTVVSLHREMKLSREHKVG